MITGFIAKDQEGHVTTLGRGGSDLTASVIGKALHVEEIQLWKDVDGILTADPRLVPKAHPVVQLSFAEASELAYFGAKVLHPSAILPAMCASIPVRVKNHRDPYHPGTLIINTSSESSSSVVAIAHKSHQTLVHITSTRMLGQPGFLAHVFQIFADLKLSVDVIATSEVSVSLTLSHSSTILVLEEKLKKIAHVKMEDSKSIVSLVGKKEGSGALLESVMRILNQEQIEVQMISYGASKINTSLVIDDSVVERCIKALYQHFFQGEIVCELR